ncbi:hypothetical protein EPA93_26550 [Ktedonosporobacter rubrisoli]|uniref:HTH luxR-type domain-containing protein n=1 Tax=Ktedonosporobacter rubrisoli TaxID=2509675 RepID=A0A4P6JWH6_KTERU|nr:LuxR C-terminal-related transcriptional regulator [Ktedonosporobacter rubrisoli]QBD79356.1 hypothetical protein EPA93_26550 [Ktedonosporobacter rubrisoli]
MPKTARYALMWSAIHEIYELHQQDGELLLLLAAGDPAWLNWLNTHTAFAFHSRDGMHLNLLKEARKSKTEGYWYAYQRQGKRVVKRYAGRSVELSIELLEEMARTIAGLSSQAMEAQDSAKVQFSGGIVSQPGPQSPLIEQTPLLEAKLSLPHLPTSLVVRERLYALLDEGLARKMTLLSAPAGFGKTTLVRQWIAERAAVQALPPLAWVSLDATDNDPARFWRYIFTACQAFQPEASLAALTLLSSPGLPPFRPSSVEMALTTFLNLATRSERSGLLMLDDYHMIAEPEIYRMLSFWLEHLPASLHLCLIGRGDPALPLARLRANGELLELRTADLRFSTQEATGFLQRALAFQLSEADIEQLLARLEGWAAGLRLVSLALQRHTKRQALEHALVTIVGSQRPVQDYFVTEVLQAQTEELQSFLLQTSILSRLCGSLCVALTGQQNSELLLDALLHAGLFLERLDEAGKWYRYHALFAEAMSVEAYQRLGTEAVHALFYKASVWYEEHELLIEAVEAAFSAQRMERAAELIEKLISGQLFYGAIVQEVRTLLRWLARIPHEVLQERPVLCLGYARALAWACAPYQPSPAELGQIEELLQQAERIWQADGNTACLGALLAFRTNVADWRREPAQASWYARRALACLPDKEVGWRGICMSVLGREALLGGQLDTARQMFIELREVWERIGVRHALRSNTLTLAIIYYRQGALHLAAEYYRQVLAEAVEISDPFDRGFALLGLAQLSYEWNALEEAGNLIHEVASLALPQHDETLQLQAELWYVRIVHAQGQHALAQQKLASLLARLLPQRDPLLYQEALVCQARFQLAQADLAAMQRSLQALAKQHEMQALSYAELARSQELAEVPVENGLQPLREREELLLARLWLAQGKFAEALALLQRLLVAAQEAGRMYSALEIQLLMALINERCKQTQESRRLLRSVLLPASVEGYLRLFLDEGEPMEGLLRSALPTIREKALLSYGRSIFQAFTLQRPAPAPAPSSTISQLEALSPQELRVLRLLAAELPYAEIARELIVSINTIKTQVRSIYRKLNVANRREAREVARSRNLL